MSPPVRDLAVLLQSLSPALHPGAYVYCCLPLDAELADLRPVVTVWEPEGRTLVLEEAQARDAGLQILYRAAWLTLTVHSDLQAVGLTAAVAQALAAEGLSCNVVAGAHHDHLFVPFEEADRALRSLQALQARAAGASTS